MGKSVRRRPLAGRSKWLLVFEQGDVLSWLVCEEKEKYGYRRTLTVSSIQTLLRTCSTCMLQPSNKYSHVGED